MTREEKSGCDDPLLRRTPGRRRAPLRKRARPVWTAGPLVEGASTRRAPPFRWWAGARSARESRLPEGCAPVEPGSARRSPPPPGARESPCLTTPPDPLATAPEPSMTAGLHEPIPRRRALLWRMARYLLSDSELWPRGCGRSAARRGSWRGRRATSPISASGGSRWLSAPRPSPTSPWQRFNRTFSWRGT